MKSAKKILDEGMTIDYGIYTTQGEKRLLGNRATVNGRAAIAYIKNGKLLSFTYMDEFASQFYSGPRLSFNEDEAAYTTACK